MINWQLIETAPKDGTDIIVYDGYDVWKAWYNDTDKDWYPSLTDELWVKPTSYNPLYHEPTHWLPISDLLQPLGHL